LPFFHLMIAGRLHWKPPSKKPPRKTDLAAFEFPTGTLTLTEAGTKRRASLHLVRGESGLSEFARGGLEVLDATVDQFAERLRVESHTVKRSLTDPRLFSGVGNAYSDEILHRARLSPVKLTRRLTDDEIATLFEAHALHVDRVDRSATRRGGRRISREGHCLSPGDGRARQVRTAVSRVRTPVQRIRYADNETNYCARCQTDGKLLADRALSRLLKEDWPRSIDEVV
jgi:formamidopyrimidine-DNA glycosylase